jgi:UDP-glucose 4-epimerase
LSWDRVEPPSVLVPSIEPFVEGDIRTPGLLDRVFAKDDIDAVIHLAAEKSVEESVRDPGRYFNNVGGTLDLVEAMERTGVDRSSSARPVRSTGRPRWCP